MPARRYGTRYLTAGPNSASVFVATHGDEIIGFAAGSLLGEPQFGLDAELTAVYLRPEFPACRDSGGA